MRSEPLRQLASTPASIIADRDLSDEALLDIVQRQTFRFFWDFAHPACGLARDRVSVTGEGNDLVAIGGSGFGIMAVIVATERGWITRDDALGHLTKVVRNLGDVPRYHGVFPHFIDGRTGATVPFGTKDDGGDLVETSFLMQGLLCARQYFSGRSAAESDLRRSINRLWQEVEWNWHTKGGRKVLFWHWSPNHGWAMNHEIHGWNECLVTYVLAAASPDHAIDAEVYHRGFAYGRDFKNGHSYFGLELPLGPAFGGPLFFAHYSFLGLSPGRLSDRYADYWDQNLRHVLINYRYCVHNPRGYIGYGPHCWGLTASDDPRGYEAHAPDKDFGVIAPTAAVSSIPYAPAECMRALRYFAHDLGDKLWGECGFASAFALDEDWYSTSSVAIDQGPIIVMIENHRSGLLWKLFMSCPEVRHGLAKLDFRIASHDV